MSEPDRPPRSILRAGTTGLARLPQWVDVLPTQMQDELRTIGTRRQFSAGNIVVEDGDDDNYVGFLLSGLLALTKILPDARRHIVGMLVPGDMYGRLFEGPSPVRVEALSDAEVLSFPREHLESLLSDSPDAERLFLAGLLDELEAAREWVLVLGGPKVVQRVAAFLLISSRREIFDRQKRGRMLDGPVNLRVQIKRVDLAHYLGARPESLSRAFHELEDEGIIRINDPYDFDVLDLDALIDIAGHDLMPDQQTTGRYPRR